MTKELVPGETLIRVKSRQGVFRVVAINERGQVRVLDRDEKSHWFDQEEVRRVKG